jgi:15-cis-phytoene synthase
VNSDQSDNTPVDYCVNKAIPDGSNLYYASLFETPANKKIIITTHAFLIELSDIILECSDPGVARIKLKWWQEEIERLFNNEARHPVSRQMQECIDLNQNLKSTFNSVIDFFNHFIFIQQTESLETILSLYKSTTGEIWSQCSQQLNNEKEDTLEAIKELGALVHFITCIQQPGTYINESRCIIPANIIKQSDLLKLINDSTDRQSKQNEAFSPLLIDLKNKLDKTYNKLKAESPTSKYVLIMNRLSFKTCDEILRDGCNILDKNIRLTPLRKLCIAWFTKTVN